MFSEVNKTKKNNMLNNICCLNFLVAGLQHAHSVGNLGLSAHHSYSSNGHLSGRSYESDDENMGRKKTRPVGHGLYPKTSVYSKGDIREQVRLHSVLLRWNCVFFFCAFLEIHNNDIRLVA